MGGAETRTNGTWGGATLGGRHFEGGWKKAAFGQKQKKRKKAGDGTRTLEGAAETKRKDDGFELARNTRHLRRRWGAAEKRKKTGGGIRTHAQSAPQDAIQDFPRFCRI